MSADGSQRETGKESRSLRERVRAEVVEHWDTDFAIACGVIVGTLGILGVTDLETTVGLTLVALAALAGSLHRDRSLREGLEAKIADLDGKLSIVSRAFSKPLPYDVISADYRWSFDPGGEVARICKRSRVRFVHNGVWTILAWHTEGVKVHEPIAHRRTADGDMRPLKVFGDLKNLPKGRSGKLIALDREYRQNEVLDFEYEFQSHGNYPDDQEWLEITIETFTPDLTIEIYCSEDRLPTDVWLSDGDRHVPLQVEKQGGQYRTRIERRNLVRDQTVLVEWQWPSTQELRRD